MLIINNLLTENRKPKTENGISRIARKKIKPIRDHIRTVYDDFVTSRFV